MKHLRWPSTALAACSCGLLWGCGAESWAPPAPAGVTYQYDYQGFRERKTNVVAGTFAGPAPGMGVAYGGAFSFRNESDLQAQTQADPYAESSAIDGIRFNEHLGNQGRRVLPIASSPVPPPPSPVSSSL